MQRDKPTSIVDSEVGREVVIQVKEETGIFAMAAEDLGVADLLVVAIVLAERIPLAIDNLENENGSTEGADDAETCESGGNGDINWESARVAIQARLTAREREKRYNTYERLFSRMGSTKPSSERKWPNEMMKEAANEKGYFPNRLSRLYIPKVTYGLKCLSC